MDMKPKKVQKTDSSNPIFKKNRCISYRVLCCIAIGQHGLPLYYYDEGEARISPWTTAIQYHPYLTAKTAILQACFEECSLKTRFRPGVA